MDYGALIREAWAITRRYRFLWAFGLFAGGAVGVWTGSGNGAPTGMGPRGMDGLGPEAERDAALVTEWVAQHLALILGAAAVLIVVGIAVLVLALIAQGAMAEATAEVGSGQPSSFRHAWQVGLHLFWRYVGLWLLLAGVAIVLAALVAAIVAAAIGIAALAGPTAGLILAPIAVIVGLPAVLAALVGAIALSVVVAYAQRAIAVEDLGPLASLRSGWLLLRAHVRESALLWLINVALAIGAGIAAGLVLVVLAGVLMGFGMLLYAAVGLALPTIVYAALGSLALLSGGILAMAIVNTFFWSYWTLAYLRLSGQAPHPSAA